MMRYGFGNGGFGMMGGSGGLLVMLLILTLVIVGFIVLVKYSQVSHNTPYQAKDNASLNILNDRYARGEINDVEYALKKSKLTKS